MVFIFWVKHDECKSTPLFFQKYQINNTAINTGVFRMIQESNPIDFYSLCTYSYSISILQTIFVLLPVPLFYFTPMENLEQLISTFSDKHAADFKKVLSLSSQPSQFILLFDLLWNKTHSSNEEIAIAIYGAANMESYYSLRKRLLEKVEDFLKSVELKEDPSGTAEVVGELLLALRALRFQKSSLALGYLKSAEKYARQTLQPNLLDQALFLEVKHAEKLNLSASDAIESWEENALRLQAFRKMEMTYSRIREEMSIAKTTGNTPDVERIIKNVFAELHIGTDEANNPEFMLRLVQAGRSVYVSVKDYKKIHPFVEKIYLRLKKANAFGPTHAASELEFIFILAHCYYRNRKFSDAQKILSDMESCIKANKGVAMAVEPRFISLKAAILCATGKNKNAIQLVETALAENLGAKDP